MPETPAPFPHAAVLARLDTGDFAGLPAEFVDTPQKREALHALLKASEAVHRAAVSTAQVADALRRDQKFNRASSPRWTSCRPIACAAGWRRRWSA